LQGRIFIKSQQKLVSHRQSRQYAPGLIAATTEGKLDIDGVEGGAPASSWDDVERRVERDGSGKGRG